MHALGCVLHRYILMLPDHAASAAAGSDRNVR